MTAPSYPPESMPSPIISVHDIGVQFSKNRRRKRSMRDLLFKGTMGPQAGDAPGEFWPFRHVTFDIKPGESIGVVGRNGAGKSTLLRLIAGVLIPDEGDVTVHAGVAPADRTHRRVRGRAERARQHPPRLRPARHVRGRDRRRVRRDRRVLRDR